MARRKHTEEKVEWHAYIPKTLAAEVELLLLDPFFQTTKYGAKSELTTKLLTDWVASQRAAPSIPSESPPDTST